MEPIFRVGRNSRVAIRLIMKRGEPMTVEEICRDTNMTKGTVELALSQLINNYPEFFSKDGRGKEAEYRFTGLFTDGDVAKQVRGEK